MTTVNVELAPKLIPVFTQQGVMFRCAWGGRGSSKTRGFALMTAIRGYMLAEQGESGVIFCGREFMNSLSDSSMEEIKQTIASVPWLADYYEFGESFIRTKNRRIEYVFAGLRHNLNSIKSKARILLAWIDEAEDVSEMAWQKLLPTIRGFDGAECWVTWNPEKRGSATDKRFRHERIYDEDTGDLIGIGVELNYTDNPWFPDILDKLRRRDQRTMDDATYRWIWEGAYLEGSEAQVFKDKYVIKEFEPDPLKWDGAYQGLDFGFAKDPTAFVRSWIKGNTLYIRNECGRVGLELDDTVPFILNTVPDADKYKTYADNARPESISYLKRHGLTQCSPCEKGKGSVEDGIDFMKSFDEIVIHPSCINTIEEFRNYSYKKDRLTGDVLPILLDEWNHYIDAIRYSLVPVMKGRGNILDLLM